LTVTEQLTVGQPGTSPLLGAELAVEEALLLAIGAIQYRLDVHGHVQGIWLATQHNQLVAKHEDLGVLRQLVRPVDAGGLEETAGETRRRTTGR
jgi:hypothetical protein